MRPLRASDIFCEGAELAAQGNQDLVFIFNGFYRDVLEGVTRGARPGGQSDEPSRKGMSSSLVRSGPRAKAMVERR